MLDQSLKEQLKAYLGHLKQDVTVTAYLDDSEGSKETQALLSDIAEASPRVHLARGSGEGRRVPSFGIHPAGIHPAQEEPRVVFVGLPLGHEFTSLVLALLHVGGHPPKISADELSQIEGLKGPLKFETYFSQSCQNCPDVVQALNLMAARNPNVSHVAIDGALFQPEVEERQIMAVPTLFLNGKPFGQGRMELSEVLSKVDDSAVEKKREALDQKEVFDVLIVGGGPAGAAAAIYAARKGFRTGVVADKFGGQVLDTLSIENFISVSATEGPKLASALEEHVKDYPVDVMKHERAARLLPGEISTGKLSTVELESGAKLRARSVIAATGARWRDLGVPGESEYRNRGVTYCPHCDGPLFKGKRVAVVGGGNSGVEAAIDLAGVVAHVTLIEFAEELKADDILKRKLKSMQNVDIVVGARTTEIVGNERSVTALRYEERKSGTFVDVGVEGVFVQIGLLPNTDWLKGVVELTRFGEIVVDAHGRTSVPGVFAAGDVTTTPYKQIIIATGDGAKAALGAFDYLIRQSAPDPTKSPAIAPAAQ